ncbi:MAG: glycosyltransferase family 2 protein [Candidatus Cryptobacteroides sp.]
MNRICIVIPTYNNSGTVARVIESALGYCGDVYVVSDGADEATVDEILKFGDRIRFLSYSPNRGKGYALKTALRQARQDGFDYAITMDSDGQHFAEDIPLFKKAIAEGNGELFIGSRCLQAENMPSGNTFANKFSNFWFMVQTLHRLPDTQTGFRAYPLDRLVTPLTNRYEAELEMLVRSAWRGVRIVPVEIKVYYPPAGERISHFRKGMDFTRISILNTVLTLTALVYGWPSILYYKIKGLI